MARNIQRLARGAGHVSVDRDIEDRLLFMQRPGCERATGLDGNGITRIDPFRILEELAAGRE
mgnify:CR=1 FL=1